MKRKHVIEQQALKIEELETETEYYRELIRDKNEKIGELHHKLNSNNIEYGKIKKLAERAVKFINTLTHDLKIN